MGNRINTFTHVRIYGCTTREREQSVVNEKCKLIEIT